MGENMITDLKQFIATTVSQQTSKLREGISKIDKKIDIVDKKIDDLSVSVAEALDVSNDTTEVQLKDHDHRITRLEQKVA
jgi:hypothetical protein